MATIKVEKLIIGSGDITNNNSAASYYAGSELPPPSLGVNGDIYVRVGDNADFFQKKDDVWTSLAQEPVQTVTLPVDDTTSWLEVPITLFRGIFIEYIITRDNITQQGKIDCINNGSNLSQLVNYAINMIGGTDIGIQFGTDIDTGRMRCLATVNANGSQPTIKFTFRGWI